MTDLAHANRRRGWWFEPEAGAALLLVCLFYLPRLGDGEIRGEEPRRVRVAVEILQFGEWIVPHEQGKPYFSRPPLQNWVIAASCSAFESQGPQTVRLPSVLCVLATVWVIYGYSRNFLGRAGAMVAGLAYPTAVEMFQTGRQAETEALYAFLIATSLLIWHWGLHRGWNSGLTWSAAYGLAGCAALTKGGFQAHVYLLGAASIYLLLSRRLRELFTVGHLAGAAVGAAVIASWMTACADRVGWVTTTQIWTSNTAYRFRNWQAADVIRHLVEFPAAVAGSLLPWSPALLAYLSGGFRRALGEARPAALFCGLAAGLGFLTIWIPPHGLTRYYTPLYPCLAVLVGILADRWERGVAPVAVGRACRSYLSAVGVLFGLAALLLPASPWIASAVGRPEFAPGPVNSWIYAAGVGLAAAGLLQCRRLPPGGEVRLAALTLACGTALVAAGILADIRMKRMEDTAAAVAGATHEIPPGFELVSLGRIDALFAYHYGTFIPSRPWEDGAAAVAPGEFFCFNSPGATRLSLPFCWVEIGVVPLDRFHSVPPQRVVVVGRRL